ncbi:Hypothetical predicted protein, partial [Paramuricea clavata]
VRLSNCLIFEKETSDRRALAVTGESERNDRCYTIKKRRGRSTSFITKITHTQTTTITTRCDGRRLRGIQESARKRKQRNGQSVDGSTPLLMKFTAMFEVDGAVNKIYCQNLCLLAWITKLFIMTSSRCYSMC